MRRTEGESHFAFSCLTSRECARACKQVATISDKHDFDWQEIRVEMVKSPRLLADGIMSQGIINGKQQGRASQCNMGLPQNAHRVKIIKMTVRRHQKGPVQDR